MKHKPLPPLEELKEILSYNPETGELTWKVSPNRKVRPGCVAGTNDHHGYRRITIQGKNYRANRLAWYLHTGEDPGELMVDHINRDRLDNRISNLRLVVNSDNCQNQLGTGATFHKGSQMWQSRIKLNWKSIHLGYFPTKDEAAQAYRDAKAKYHPSFTQ